MLNPYAAMARNNGWANMILLEALGRLRSGEWEATRTSFFPSLKATMEHIHAVDLYYLDAATGGGLGPRAFTEAPKFPTPADCASAQAVADARLIAFCEGLEGQDLTRRVVTDRGPKGRIEEQLDLLLLHLFQHQVHHRGQVHAMLSGSSVAPPQLDDFYLDFGRHPAAHPL